MASVTAFTDMLGQFLLELHKTFPEEKTLKKYINAFEMMKGTNPRLIVNGFMESVNPHATKISARDESFFTTDAETIDFLKEVNIKKNWQNASENTKGAIWQYLQTLYMLGTTITSIPADTLSMIENVAKECADKMQGEGGQIDENKLLQSMQGMLSGMLKK